MKTAAINIPLSQNLSQEPKKIKQKMFKIKDIDNVQLDIPSSLIPVEDIQNSHVDVEITNQTLRDVIEDDEEINKTVEPTQFEIKEQTVETNIDQCLFDPKKLLECFQKSEPLQDIIPPPIEFCDNISKTGIDFIEKEMSDGDEPTKALQHTMKQIDDDDYYEEYVQEKNVFRDGPEGPTVASINMSFSHEVETWTLSPEIEDERNFTNNSQRSCTVMRTNRSRYFNGPITSRAQKLNNFKFTKNKLHYNNTPKYE